MTPEDSIFLAGCDIGQARSELILLAELARLRALTVDGKPLADMLLCVVATLNAAIEQLDQVEALL